MSETEEHVTPVPVVVVKDSSIESEAADFGAWQTYNLTGTEAAQKILPQAPRRRRAVLIWAVPAFGTVAVGTKAEVENITAGSTGSGGGLQGNGSVVIENTGELWMKPGGNTGYLLVLDERYR